MDSSQGGSGSKRGGYTVSRRTALLLLAAVLVAVVATGLLVHQLTQCRLPRDAEGPLDALTATTSKGAGNSSALVRDVRLPRAVLPHHYSVKLVPFIWEGNFTFNGDVEILVNVTEETNNVTLHVHEIDIHRDSVRMRGAEDDSVVPVKDLGFDVARQFVILHLSRPLEAGRQYRVAISFVGKLNNALQGFYRSSYRRGNQTRWIATTQFQPTDARRAFPCFDEPALKAKFTISLGRPKNMSSVSNMPRKDGPPQPVEGVPDYEWDHYQQSVPMSTYLVAFIVFDFERQGNDSFAVWARKEALPQAEYSLSLGPRILSYYEEYFRIRFPLPKIDMVALPDFAAGAMENWGLVTYRETAMLYQPGISTNQNKQGVAVVVAHELAHQWFGNLVTPSWWSDLWLNEGFATYVETLGVNAVEPTWKILEQFVIQDLQNIFALDALKSSHPISIEVGHPDEISEIFDGISYSKGASIIRMMDHFLTTEVFKRGITNYLNKWAYRSSTQNDLWNELTAQAHADGVLDPNVTIKEIMDTWTLQTGFPVVTVMRNYRSRGATISQERFLLQSMKESKPNKQLWWVPLSFTDSEKLDFETTKPKYWMKAEKYLTLPNLEASPDSWVIFNVKETGFYRVNYDPSNWQMLTATLQNANSFEQISTINRAQLIDDSLNLARAGLLEYSTALEVTRYLEHELEFLPWKAAFNAMSYIDGILIKTGSYNAFRTYMLKLIQRLYDHTGFTDNPTDPQLTVYKRISVLNWACNLGHEDCVRNSVVLFQNWRSTADPDKTNPISGNLKNVVYCTAIRVGGQEEWDFAWQRYRNTNVGSERDLLLSALGCTREIWLLSRYLDWALTENSGIRKQDTPRVFSAVSKNVIGQPLAYSFLRNKWDYIREYVGSSQFTLNTIMRSATKKISTKFEYEDLLKFAEANRNQLGSAARALEQALELAETNVAWVGNYQDVVTQWLNNVTSTASS